MSACLVYSDDYFADIGAHVFPMEKFRLTRRLLIESGAAVESDFVAPEPAAETEVLRVHTREYLQKLNQGRLSPLEIMTLELPYSPDLVRANLLCAGGTIAACRLALVHGFAGNLAGGFHHAFPDHGEGFCVLNDIAIGLAAMLAEGRIERAAVIDLDVHQGNGTAAIFALEPRVFTCSIHQEHNYPAVKPPSDLDLGLDDGAGGREYLAAVDTALRAILAARPELLVYVAGADPYEQDQLGGLSLTLDDLRQRDERVLGTAAASGLPVAVVPAGGYARDLRDTVAIHATTLRLGLKSRQGRSWSKTPRSGSGPAPEPAPRPGQR
jgi:acetoin utilization deacetylase AcuC-like enzyme